jgi:transcriptional regulator with XRE-family HTH domain
VRFKLTDPEQITRRRNELGMTRLDVGRISRIDYDYVADMERGKLKTVAAPILEALANTLHCHPSQFSSEYEPPETPHVTLVEVAPKMVRNYLDRTGINANMLAIRADVPPAAVYGLVRRGKRSIKAEHAKRIAQAMGVRASEFAPALLVYPAQDASPLLRDGAVARARRYEARTNGERVPDRDAEDRSQGVTLEIGGDSGTKFYGTCTVGGQEKFISWRGAARYGYEPGGGKLECELREGVPAPWRSSSPPGTTYAPCSGPAPVEAL